MYLVDTSVWIDYLRDRVDNLAVQRFVDILDEGMPFGLNGLICQEILQGASSKAAFDELADYLSTQRFYSLLDEREGHQLAAALYFNCRRKGITIRNTVACLIARTAIEHDLILLHNDTDYVHLAKIFPALKIYPTTMDTSPAYVLHENSPPPYKVK
jgi:predicted nucleic acid-binding protein